MISSRPPMLTPKTHSRQDLRDVLQVFLRLGLTSFGGPIAHLGYFRHEFVDKRRWVSDSQFAQLLALCQFLPGPASSQVGFSIGLLRAGWAGALAAFCAFTVPSALLLFLFALLAPWLTGPLGGAVIHGLKLVALAVVAHGVLGMAKRLCPDLPRAAIAAVAALVLLATAGAWVQIAMVVMGALAGVILFRDHVDLPVVALPVHYGRKTGWSLFFVFLALLGGLPLAAGFSPMLASAEAFYRAGALVFGGGHVVLPFLEQALVGPGWLTANDFMAGYGAAQAVPGPMFSLAAYLGAHLPGGSGGILGAMVALVSIFLPGFLLVSSALPLWHRLTAHPGAAGSLSGVNAAVVGILAAALYNPIWVSAVHGVTDFLVALVGFVLLAVWRMSALTVVLWCVTASVLAVVWL